MPGRFEDNESQDEVEILTAKITEMITKSKNKVKRIENEQVVNPQEQQIKKNLQMSLATQLQDLATGFKKSQKDYFDRLKGKQAKLQQFDPVDDGYNSTPQDINTGMTQRQLDTIQVNHELIQQRNEELKNIAKSINEIVEIFRDLGTLVVEQGTILDRIDHNIELASESVVVGVTNLKKGAQTAKATNKLLWIMILCVFIVIMVVIIIIKSQLG